MPRRLEDVSHLFLGEAKPSSAVTDVTTLPQSLPSGAGPMTVYLVSQDDHIPASIVVACIAGIMARGGQHVLVGQTHEHVFGPVFGLNGYRAVGEADPVVRSDVGPWIARTPLVGRERPGVFCDHGLRRQWDARATASHVVMVHVNAEGDGAWPSLGPPPDEVVFLAGEASYESVTRAYQAVKRAVADHPDVRIRLLLLTSDDAQHAGWMHIVRAVNTFLGKPCAVAGPVPDVGELAPSFLAGRLWDGGGDRVWSTISPLVAQWIPALASPNGVRRLEDSVTPSANAALFGAATTCR
ncbi:MAG: hypothetical protein ACOYXR_07120 [Nitrospirota bacterium]